MTAYPGLQKSWAAQTVAYEVCHEAAAMVGCDDSNRRVVHGAGALEQGGRGPLASLGIDFSRIARVIGGLPG